MARAWILKPSILLMDEPSASLDKESIERSVIMAEDLLQRGASLVITSHQTNALTDLCKKQWWIKDNTLTESPLLQVIQKDKATREYLCCFQRKLVGLFWLADRPAVWAEKIKDSLSSTVLRLFNTL
eukprot:TRINITY_DN7551_c0_g1_i2.p1 TRINITY_DN7551_c0_g1~~TRINITY_DN7551_c0_g1_i2.p1  ORF type:complete len:146 (+),score=7.84 TRINITY_DN7551_c0_g1_i2:60-440(+)